MTRISSDLPSDLRLFKELCVRYTSLMAAQGFNSLPFCETRAAAFRSKPLSIRQQQIRALSIDILSLESMITDGISLRDSRTHLVRFLSMMDYQLQADMLEKISPEDSVDIYLHAGGEQHQIFRNLRSFELTSFPLEQVLGLNWQTAYIHEPEFRSDVLEAISHCSAAPRPATISYHPRLHVLTEVGSTKSRTFSTTMKYLSPLLQHGQIKAFLSTNHSRILAATK